MNKDELYDEIKEIYLNWFNADLNEDVEAVKTLYKIGEHIISVEKVEE